MFGTQFFYHLTIFLAFSCINVFQISNLAFLTPNFYTFFLDLPPKMSLFILVNSSFSSPVFLTRNSLYKNSSFLVRKWGILLPSQFFWHSIFHKIRLGRTVWYGSVGGVNVKCSNKLNYLLPRCLLFSYKWQTLTWSDQKRLDHHQSSDHDIIRDICLGKLLQAYGVTAAKYCIANSFRLFISAKWW